MMSKSDTTKEARRFSSWLDVTLENQHVSGHAVAEAVGVHDSAVSRWRNGTTVPSLDVMGKLAELLHLEPLRLAVTAGQIPSKVAGVSPYPTPVPTARWESVRAQIGAMHGLTQQQRAKLVQTYNEMEHTA